MLKKEIEFTDHNGNKQKQTHYFHFSKAELVRLEVSGEGNSLSEQLLRIGARQSGKEIMDVFDMLISKSYGERSIDGANFVKNDELLSRFKSSEAFSELFLELVGDPDKAIAFWNELVPADVIDAINKEEAARKRGEAVAQTARERSEASMQGFNKPAEREPVVINETAPAVVSDSKPGLDELEKEFPRSAYPNLGDEEYAEFLRFKSQSR